METRPRSIRLPPVMWEYFDAKDINPRRILEEKFAELKKHEFPEAQQELKKAKESVLHWEQIVTQLEQERVTKQLERVTQNERSVLQELKNAEYPDWFLGKEINGITVTQSLIDKALNQKGGP